GADDAGDFAHAIGERGGAGLQDDRRLHLVQLAVAHRRNRVPAGAGGDLVGAEFLPAPGTEDDVGRAAHDLAGVFQDPRLRERLQRALREDVVAAGDADELGDPADSGDRRLVPFLEVDPGPARQRRGLRRDLVEAALQLVRIGIGARRGAHQRAEPAHVVDDAVDAAVVADPDLDPTPHELGGDVGLDVGEADDEIRFELQDLADLRAGERTDLGLLAPRPRRAHREAADADDAILLAERVQDLGRLLGEADDPARTVPRGRSHGYSIRLDQRAATSRSYSQRSCQRNRPAYQNSIQRGRTRNPVQRGGRGMSRPSKRASTPAMRCSNVARSTSVSDCSDAHAPTWLPRARLTKYASASSSGTVCTRPSIRTCTPWRTRGQWNSSAAYGLACSSRPLRPSMWV